MAKRKKKQPKQEKIVETIVETPVIEVEEPHIPPYFIFTRTSFEPAIGFSCS